MPNDIFGRAVKVGDVVVPTNESTFRVYSAENALVVTRLGSEVKVQVNGYLYAHAEYLLIVNEQFVHQFGQEALNNLRKEYESYFNYEQVTTPNSKTPRYIVNVIQTYVDVGEPAVTPKIIITPTFARTKSEAIKDLAYIQQIKQGYALSYGIERVSKYDDVKFVCQYGSINFLSGKALAEIGLDKLPTKQLIPMTGELLESMPVGLQNSIREIL